VERAAEFYRFMRAREQIRLNREAGLPWPWTDDPILLQYKFTNVKRAHDKTTRLLREEFYERYPKDYIRKTMLYNCALFRYFGTIEFARAVGWQTGHHNPSFVRNMAKSRLKEKKRVFTGAYVITNQGIKAPKQDVVVDIFLAGLWEHADAIVKAADTGSWRAAIEELQKVQGFGGTGFMAKEVMLDTMFTPFWPEPPHDLNTWCPAGPGARRGVNRLLGRDLKVSMKTSGALGYMLELFELSKGDAYWPSYWIELELHDIQFQLCEFDKYERVRLGQGRPRSRYRHE